MSGPGGQAVASGSDSPRAPVPASSGVPHQRTGRRCRADRRARPAGAGPPPAAQLAATARLVRPGAGHAPPRRHRHARRPAHVGIGPPAAVGGRRAVRQLAAAPMDVAGPRPHGRRPPRREEKRQDSFDLAAGIGAGQGSEMPARSPDSGPPARSGAEPGLMDRPGRGRIFPRARKGCHLVPKGREPITRQRPVGLPPAPARI
jgi:hypothetical protein